jgi:hypothetical protein
MATLALSDDLYERASQAAAAQGATVDEFVGETLRRALSKCSVRQTVRNGLPVMVVSETVPTIDMDRVRQEIEEEGF